ncbi:ankyrin repeat and SOCS box protein 13-like isoform X2 [Phyllopteryx taeniolatus]|uniref:ankyrin repeat and SOCS box protein 13-like isoform X2 n=1 Tax=Phyllopteryx taeniolatus TaxID=161469 RepID=UPI002AD36D88|nr:ankyrin repeat and SOCS box protein 13-like isoform X2 [Phyllopteryx taeniolatus]
MDLENIQPYYFGDISCWSERTEVHKAASLGQASHLQHLIQCGASVNIVAVDSITPLHEACLRGQAQCARLLLDAGAQVTTSHGEAGNSDCVKLLIAEGACLEAYDLYYGTPLHVACANQHTRCVKELLNAGAKVNAARLHQTALHHAAKSAQVELIDTLVDFGANIYARDKHNKKPVDYATPDSPAAACLRSHEAIPMSLQQLCRLAVRQKLGTRALKVVVQLQLPKLIISYLCYQ